MEFLQGNIRRDAPASANEIQLDNGNLTREPKRVQHAGAPSAAKYYAELKRQTEIEIAEKQAAVEAARVAALAIQARYEELIAVRNGLAANVPRAERELATCLQRVAELETYVEQNWCDVPLHDHMNEHFRQTFM